MSANKSRDKDVASNPAMALVRLRVPKHVADRCDLYTDEELANILADAVRQPVLPPEPPKKPLLQRANELIGGDRQSDYGNKLQNFAQIAMLWQAVLAPKLQAGAKITPEDYALCMMQVKIARLTTSPDHEDSILDVAGYAGCYEALQNERAQGWKMLGATVDARARPQLAERGYVPGSLSGANRVGSGLSLDQFTNSKQDVTKISR